MSTVILARQWFMFSTKPNLELKAQELLERSGYTAAVPCINKWRRKHRTVKTRRRTQYPALPSYILIGFQPGPIPFHDLHAMPMIGGVVGLGKYASQLDSQQVARWLVHPRFDADGLKDLFKNMRTYHEYKLGDDVQILEGGFDGHKGRVVELDPTHARVLVPMFGSEYEVQIPVAAAVKAA